MSRVLVTGAAGFLGSHLCERLLTDGHDVVGMDNQITGRAENLDAFADDPAFTYDRTDVTGSVDVDGVLDHVLHLASIASPVFYKANPIETLTVGSRGTKNTLDLARENDATYLFTSTSEVYGDPEVNPQPEDYRGNVDCYGPRACYDESKRYGEALVRAYRDEHDLAVRVARIFNTYGPRMSLDDGRVVPNFLKQALRGDPLTVHGDGSQTRSFCYVDDLIDGLMALLESDVDTPVNLGSEDERTIMDLAETVLEVTDSDSAITHEDRPPQDPSVRRPDLTKARSELEWEPEISLKEGLERTVPYFESKT